MTDRDHHPDDRRDWAQASDRQPDRDRDRERAGRRPSGGPPDFEETAYGRPETGVSNRSEGMGYSPGGFGDQGGFGSQHGQGGFASPAQGSRYGQTGAEWGRSGYGEEPNRPGRGEPRGRGGREAEYGFQGQGGGGAQWGGARGAGEGGYGAAGGTYGQQDYSRSAQRSQDRTDQQDDRGFGATSYADVRGRSGAGGPSDISGREHDHDPSYRRWRDEQLANHDREYGAWRTSQAKRYDDDYGRYRDERHSQFRNTFEDWRNKNGPASADTHPSHMPSASATQASAGSTAGADAPLAADAHLQNVSDGGSGHADKPKDGDKAS